MRRMMISRSSKALLSLGLAAALAQPLLAQEDTTAAGERPREHVVREGETLWDLAAVYFGDPFLWPEIYRLNTTVVEDPHWIFPGEVLRLGEREIEREPADVTAVEAEGREAAPEPEVETPPPPPPPPPSETTPSIFAPKPKPVVSVVSAEEDKRRGRTLLPNDFYAAGFLTEGETMPWGEVLGPADNLRRDQVQRIRSSNSVRLFEELEVEAPPSAEYLIGDSLLISRLVRDIPNWGDVVKPTGVAVVTSQAGRRARARLVKQYGIVANGQVTMPLEPFKDLGYVEPVPIENGTTGSIITTRDRNPVPNREAILFIDLGRSDGVSLGDQFEVIKPNTSAGAPPTRLALMKIVHLREHSASGMLLRIYDTRIEPGATVRLVKKMPT